MGYKATITVTLKHCWTLSWSSTIHNSLLILRTPWFHGWISDYFTLHLNLLELYFVLRMDSECEGFNTFPDWSLAVSLDQLLPTQNSIQSSPILYCTFVLSEASFTVWTFILPSSSLLFQITFICSKVSSHYFHKNVICPCPIWIDTCSVTWVLIIKRSSHIMERNTVQGVSLFLTRSEFVWGFFFKLFLCFNWQN